QLFTPLLRRDDVPGAANHQSGRSVVRDAFFQVMSQRGPKSAPEASWSTIQIVSQHDEAERAGFDPAGRDPAQDVAWRGAGARVHRGPLQHDASNAFWVPNRQLVHDLAPDGVADDDGPLDVFRFEPTTELVCQSLDPQVRWWFATAPKSRKVR